MLPFVATRVALEAAPAGAGSGGWTVVEIVCHMRDAELVLAHRLDRILHEQKPRFEAFDPDAVAGRGNYASTPLGEALAGFADARAHTVRVLEPITGADWSRAGIRANGDAVTVQELAAYWVAHDAQHLEQLVQLVASP